MQEASNQSLQSLVDSLIQERSKTHGDFQHNTEIMQELKTACRNGVRWKGLTSPQKEAIEMICHKLGRIVGGNPDVKDHWDDIAGYATLIAKTFPKRINLIFVPQPAQ